MKFFTKFFSLLLIIPALFIGPYFSFLSYKNTKADVLIIETGDSAYKTLGNILPLSVFDKYFLRLHFNIENIKDIKAGEYLIKNKTIEEIIEDISNGNYLRRSIRIREGSNLYDLEKDLSNHYLINDCSYLSCINTKTNKEGLLLPDTYYYFRGMKLSSIYNLSNEKLFKLIDKLWLKKPLDNPLKTKYDALILASIIEKEAGNNDEKLLISSVFLKRLEMDMRLQADPTIIYGLLPNFDGDIKKSDILNKENLYNTYMKKGLPPSPIAFSSISSIEAAILGTPGEFLFFVADSPSSHYFSKTYEEHKQAIKRYGVDK